MKYDYSDLVKEAIASGQNRNDFALGVVQSIIEAEHYTAKEAIEQSRAFLEQFKAAKQEA